MIEAQHVISLGAEKIGCQIPENSVWSKRSVLLLTG